MVVRGERGGWWEGGGDGRWEVVEGVVVVWVGGGVRWMSRGVMMVVGVSRVVVDG